jgi:hypothetical protein
MSDLVADFKSVLFREVLAAKRDGVDGFCAKVTEREAHIEPPI